MKPAAGWLLACLAGMGTGWAAESPRNYLEYVRRFADTLREKGVDRYGPRHTPLWAGVIDARTLTVPASGVPAPAGVRESDRAVGGCNLYHDAVTLRVFRVLSALSGDGRYRDAAGEYMRFALQALPGGETGLLAWGEHLYYDFFRDAVAAERRSHELLEWTPPWPELWETNPGAVAKAIAGLRYHYYADDPRALYNRHAGWGTPLHQKPGGQPWIKHSGLYAYSFLFLHRKTGETRWLDWARGAADLYWNRRDPQTGLTLSCIDDPRPGSRNASSGMVYLAYWLLKGYHEDPRRKEMRDRAVAYLKAYDRHFYDARREGYRQLVSPQGQPVNDDLTPPWHFAYGESSILPLGRVAAYFARTEKEPAALEMAGRIHRIARKTAVPEKVSIEGLGFALNLALDLYDLTGKKAYLEDARHYADLAIGRFWVEAPGGGLFVREPGDRYYEAKTGAGDAVAGLLRLHLRLNPKLKDPGLYDWSF